jgi:hypothetical protein
MSDLEVKEPPDDPDNIPKKSGHRASRAIENKKFNEFVIKCSLKQGLKISKEFEAIFLDNINKRVEQVSKMAQRMSIAVNIMIRECIENNAVIPMFLSKPNTGATFLYQIAAGMERSKKPSIVVSDFLKKHDSLLPSKECVRFAGDTNSIVTMAQTYITNYRTFIETTFKKNQEKYICMWLKKNKYDTKYANFIRYKINNWDYSKLKNVIELESCSLSFIKQQQQILNIENGEKISSKWVKENYENVVVYYSFISKFFVENEMKAITVAPLCKMKSSFITIDTNVLYGILKECGMNRYTNIKDFKENSKEIRNELFKAENLLTKKQLSDKNFKFTGIINTDGTTINFHYRRPKLVINQETAVDRNSLDVRVIANDPGRKTLFYGVEELGDGKFKTYKFSRNKFYKESGATVATKKCNMWNEKYLKNELAELSATNSRSLYLKDFLLYVAVICKNYDKFWGEYLKKKYSRQRFNLYSRKQKSYAKFFKSLDDKSGKKLVIAFGDAGFVSTTKNELSAPTTTLEKQCKKWYKVLKVDEFRTTQLHCDTGDILQKVKEVSLTKNGKTFNKTIRGLLRYKTANFCKFIDRDLNAPKTS